MPFISCLRLREMRNICTILSWKFEGKKPLGWTRCRWKDSIEVGLKKNVEVWRVPWIGIYEQYDECLSWISAISWPVEYHTCKGYRVPWTCLCAVTRCVSKRSYEVQFFFVYEGNKTLLNLSVFIRPYNKCDTEKLKEMILDCGRPGRIIEINYTCRSFIIGTVLFFFNWMIKWEEWKDSISASHGNTRFSSSTSASKPNVDILRKIDISGGIILKLKPLDTIDWPILWFQN